MLACIADTCEGFLFLQASHWVPVENQEELMLILSIHILLNSAHLIVTFYILP